MPRPSKRSIAASARNKNNRQIIQTKDSEHQHVTVLKKLPDDSNNRNCLCELNVPYVSKVNGNFHQGDEQFSSRSRGTQCSCISLVLLCKIDFIFENLTPDQLDSILRSGDSLYKNVAQELDENKELADDGYLDNYQLPGSVTIDGTDYIINYMYEDVQYGTFDDTEAQGDLKTLETALNSALAVSQKNIIILGGSMMAIYMNNETKNILFFDPHSRDESGFPCPDGSSFAIIFHNINNLIIFLHKLADKLNVRPRHFGIQPLISTQENLISTQPDSSAEESSASVAHTVRPKSKQSRFQKWYSNLDIKEKEALLSRTKRQSKAQYHDPEKANRKRQISKETYQNPEKAKRKRQISKETYQNPEKAKRKRQQARQVSKVAYQNPEKAKRKRQQARQVSKVAYQNPEKAKRKRQQARQVSKVAYQNPEKAKRKRQISKETYQNPEKAKRKRQISKETYQNPEKAKRKRQQARTFSKVTYQKQAKRYAKIQTSRNQRPKTNSNIATVIKKFQRSCQKDHVLVYKCQICHRINFRYQVQKFQRNKYQQHVLNKCTIAMANGNLPNKTKDELWICKTCHINMKSGTVPKLALTNKLFLYKQPQELSRLNMLERHLVSPAIPFMKMVPLIKGAQNGINGQVVCVKADINNTAECLPRLPTDHNLLRVKLKRKLEYKGHHMCQDINPSNIRDALSWLKDHNPNYDNIDINFDAFDSTTSDQLIHADHPKQEDFTSSTIESDALTSDADIQLPDEFDENNLSDDDNAINGADIVWDNEHNESMNEIYDDVNQSMNKNFQDDSIQNDTEDNKEEQNSDPSVNTDNDIIEENDDITNTSAPLYSFLHPVDFAQYLADKHDTSILAVAPGEDNIPERVLEMEAQCFPVEFPDGSNTNIEKREQKLSASRYFNSRLFSADNRFARNPEYIFFALYATEVEQIHSNVSIAMRIGATKTSSGEKITASMLGDHEQVKKIIQRDEGYRFLAHIRGTPAYWEKSKRDLFAMIRQLGIPTWFLTFSAADRRWMDIDNAILEMQGKPQMTEEQHDNMSWEEHCDNIMSNPVAAARMFQQRIKALINDVIMSKANPIGEVEDFYYRTEFQQRGWPHIHMVAWVKNAPKLNENSDEEVVQFVDKYITCEMPPESDKELHDIVTNVQLHTKRHTKSCRKTGKVCRFHFPRPPSDKTFICTPTEPIQGNEDDPNYAEAAEKRLQDKRKAKDTLEKLWGVLQEDDSTEKDIIEVLDSLGISQAELEDYLALMSNRQTLYLKRGIKDQWVNNYNKDLIRCWNGNMDIQYVLDPYACAMYIVSYINKAEREMGDLLKNAQKEAREGNTDAVAELRKLGSVYLQHREISVMGAIYLTCSMPLRNSTRNIVFVQTSEDGQKISLPLKQLQENAGKSDQVWMTTQIDKYVGRPRTPEYNNMCMATFFSKHYQISGKSGNNKLDTNDDELQFEEDEETNSAHHNPRHCKNKQPITLQNCPVKMKERKGKPAVIRYPRISVNKDKERYHMNMLRLYLPHRSKNIKPPSFTTYEEYHLTGLTTINGKKEPVKEIIDRNMSMFEPKTDELDEAWEQLKDAVELEDAWAALNPQCEQQRLDDQLDNVRFDDSDDDFADIQIPELQSKSNTCEQNQVRPRCAIETCIPKISQEQANSMMRNLNDKQRQVFNYVSKWCDDKVRDNTIQPFHIFVTGGAGTGKSHVINCIKHYAEKTFSSTTDSADDKTVLLVAHTGTAAFNISGQTICSALKINPKSPRDYTPLAEDSLNTLRVKYRHLKLLIIDEISMVSAPILSYIHGRLQQIKGTSEMSYFGHVSVLAVGDFYQLPPICPSTPLCFPSDEILKDIWNRLFQKVELTQIMRQKDDAVFAQMLNRLRVRKQSEPLDNGDEQLLESRRINNDDNLTPPPDALHLFYFNKDVDAHNKAKLSTLNSEIYTIKARDIDQSSGRIIKVHETPHRTTRKDDTCLVPELELAVGARVMLIANVDVLDGLCNGVSGIIKGILFGSSNNMPQVVYVKFDSDRIGMKARSAKSIPARYNGCVPIEPRKETFQIKGKTFSTTREQFPLKLAWAVTIHKVQGQTTETAVISMKGLKSAMAYVALSRVTSLNGMYLVDYDAKKIYCNNEIETHIANMPSCDISTANPLLNVDHMTHFIVAHQNIQRLNTHIDDLKSNKEIRRAHVICLSETWLDDNTNIDHLFIEGFTLETANSGSGRGVAMYIQNSVNYTVLPLRTNDCDILAIKTYGATNMIIVVVYKPVRTSLSSFRKEINDITAQLEILDTKYTLFLGDFNIDLLSKDTSSSSAALACLAPYYQIISQPTTRCFPKGTLLDHIYIKPKPGPTEYDASVLTTYYSYHYPVAITLKC